MNKVQKRWNDFFADKEWSIRDGWHYKGTHRKYKGEYVSFFKTILLTILKLFITFVIGCILDIITNMVMLSAYFIIIVWFIIVVRALYIIIKNLIKRNLRL